MPCIASIRVAEPWNLGNVLGALLLIVIIGVIVFWTLRRR